MEAINKALAGVCQCLSGFSGERCELSAYIPTLGTMLVGSGGKLGTKTSFLVEPLEQGALEGPQGLMTGPSYMSRWEGGLRSAPWYTPRRGGRHLRCGGSMTSPFFSAPEGEYLTPTWALKSFLYLFFKKILVHPSPQIKKAETEPIW
jgi:hypothetical protein